MDLKEIQRAIKAAHERARTHSLTEADIRKLRDALSSMPEMDEDPVERSAAWNAQVLDTQLRDLVERLDGGVLDESTFRALPPHLQSRISGRLDNIVERLERSAKRKASDPDYKSAVFQCHGDYVTCRKSGSKYVCGLLFATCVLSSILSIKISGGG